MALSAAYGTDMATAPSPADGADLHAGPLPQLQDVGDDAVGQKLEIKTFFKPTAKLSPIFDKSDKSTPRTLRYPVSKKGLYRLQKVVDKSKLEVRRQSNDVAVVACPRAVVSAKNIDKCVGELSGVSLEVTGVPPFLVKYNKKIDHHQYSSITQTVQDAEEAGIVLDQVVLQ